LGQKDRQGKRRELGLGGSVWARGHLGGVYSTENLGGGKRRTIMAHEIGTENLRMALGSLPFVTQWGEARGKRGGEQTIPGGLIKW